MGTDEGIAHIIGGDRVYRSGVDTIADKAQEMVAKMLGFIKGAMAQRRLKAARAPQSGALVFSPKAIDEIAKTELKLAPATILPTWQANRPLFPTWNSYNAVNKTWKESGWTYACTMANANALSELKWLAYRRQPDGTLDKAPGTNLQRLLDKPNATWSQRELIMRIALELQLTGNSVISKQRFNRVGEPVQIFTMRPTLIAPVPGKDVHIAGYSAVYSGKRFFVGRKDAVHIQLPDIGNVYWGHAPAESGQIATATDLKAAQWQSSSIDNKLVPPGMFVSESGLSPLEFEAAKEELREYYAGGINAGMPLLLGKDIKYTALSTSATDLDWINGRKMSREEVCSIYQVPPPIVGINDNSTYNNIETARQIWWETGVLPKAGLIADSLTRQLAGEFGDDLVVMPDISRVPALVKSRLSRVETVQKLWQMGASLNEAMEFAGLDWKFGSGDIPYVPANMIPATPEGQLE